MGRPDYSRIFKKYGDFQFEHVIDDVRGSTFLNEFFDKLWDQVLLKLHLFSSK